MKPRPGNPAWKKGGKSPNPGGRPKTDPELIAIFRAKVPDAARRLFEVMEDPKTPPAVVVKAAEVVTDRALGRPSQTIGQDPDKPFSGGPPKGFEEAMAYVMAGGK